MGTADPVRPKAEILAKRMGLLERTIKTVNQLPILEMYNKTVNYNLIEGESLIRSGSSAAPTLPPVLEGAVRVKETQQSFRLS